jgi:hypothetical protein
VLETPLFRDGTEITLHENHVGWADGKVRDSRRGVGAGGGWRSGRGAGIRLPSARTHRECECRRDSFRAVFKTRRFAALSLSLYLVSLSSVALTSLVTGPAFDELGRIASVGRAERVILDVVEHGASAMVDPKALKVFDENRTHGTWATLLGAWLSLAAKQGGGFDVLTAARAPFLAIAASLPLALFWIAERGLGRWLAVLGAALVVCQPWFLHAAAIGADDVTVSALWLLVFAAYTRALVVPGASRRPRRAWALATAAALGIGLATRLSTLWVVFPILVHFAFVHRRSLRRALVHGRIPAPVSVVLAVVVTPLCFAACSPDTWRISAPKLIRVLLQPLGAASVETLYRGELVAGPPFPVTYGVHWLIAKMPLVVTVLGIVGIGFWVRRSFTASVRDRTAVGFAALLFAFGAIAGQPFVPALLASHPPRTVATAAFLALSAVLALDAAVGRVLPERWRRPGSALALATLAGVLLLDLPASGGNFSMAVGGPARVLSQKTFTPSDGSEVAVAAAIIEGSGAERVSAPDVPDGYWSALERLGRPGGGLTPVKKEGQADFVLVRGEDANAKAEVLHHRAVLWSLVPR